MEELLILLQVQVIRAWEVCAAGHLDSKLGIVQHIEDIRNDRLLVDVDAEHLSLLVDTNNSVGCLVFGSDEDGLPADTVHVKACPAFKVVQVDEAVFGDEVDDAVLFGDLHSDREVVLCLCGEEYVYGLLRKDRVGRSMVDFYNVKLTQRV